MPVTPNASACARHLGEQALRAVLHEAAVIGKPGLVCPDSTGVHEDMDIQCFFTSAVALHPFFRAAAAFGCKTATWSPDAVFPQLRQLGKAAEVRMFQATRGVNTHKGLIFSLGLLCAGAGRLVAHHPETPPDAVSVARTAAYFVQGVAERELLPLASEYPQMPHADRRTAGERFFQHTGSHGIRGEVESGFPHALQAAEILHQYREKDWNTAALLALLYLMSEVDDSVVWNRGGDSGVMRIRQGALRVLALPPESGVWHQTLSELRQECVRYRLSPGGSADLLAAAIFLRFVEDEAVGRYGGVCCL